MRLNLTTAPATEPISASEARDHLRVVGTDDDSYIAACVVAARQAVEQHTNLQLVNGVYSYQLDAFPLGDVLWLPKPPLRSVDSITYIATGGTTETFSTDSYTVDGSTVADGVVVGEYVEQGRVYLGYGKTWPPSQGIENAVTVTFTCGYGSAAAVPQAIRQAVLLLAGDLYEVRTTQVGEKLYRNDAVMSLLWPFRQSIIRGR